MSYVMNRRFTLLTLFVLSFFSGVCQIAQDQYIFESITKEAGFSFSSVRGMTTDKNNMLWFGCENGLYYYDNESFRRYRFDEEDDTTISSNHVCGLFSDSAGRLWIWTDRGLDNYDFASDSFVRVISKDVDSVGVTKLVEYKSGEYLFIYNGGLYTLQLGEQVKFDRVDFHSGEYISELHFQSADKIYIGCRSGRVYTFTSRMDHFEVFHSLRSPYAVTSICENYERLYIGYAGLGIDVVDVRGKAPLRSYRADANTPSDRLLPSCDVREIVARSSGDVWVATATGLVVITPSSMTIVKSTPYNDLPRNSIFSLHVDAHNSVWVGTWAGSVAYYNDANYRFRSSRDVISSNPSNYGIGMVYHFAPNDDSTVWAASEWAGLSLFDFAKNRIVARYGHNLHIKSIFKDDRGDLWIGTIKQGLYHFDTKSREISAVEIAGVDMTEHIISDLMVDKSRSSLWIGTRGDGLFRYDISSGACEHYSEGDSEGFVSNSVWAMQEVEQGVLVATDGGLMLRRSDSGEFVHYAFTEGGGRSRCIYSITPSKDAGMYYLATKERGIQTFDIESGYKPFIQNERVESLEVYDLLLDEGFNLWFSTDDGVYRYNHSTDEISSFSMEDGLNTSRFHPASCCLCDGNVLFFGSTNGFNYIAADLITPNSVAPRVYISNVRVNGEMLSSENCIGVNSKHNADIAGITLSHDNNTITFNVVSDNVLKANDNRFRYRLAGYANEWSEVGAGESIVFTKVPFGHYSFEVASCNNDGVWGAVRQVNLHILPPLYLRWYAILLYVVVFVLLSIFIIRELMFRMKMRREIEFEREINIVNSRSFDEKVKFFMNVSHELRTPLSLILAPLNILEREVVGKESLMHFNAIKRNTKRLLSLTNQILDFRLLEVGRLSAVRSRVNVVDLCRESCEYYEYQVVEQRIAFEFKRPEGAIFASIDRDMIGKAIYNLLSNALKYTDEEGSVTLSVERRELGAEGVAADLVLGEPIHGDVVVVTVEDSGCGIAQSDMANIFDRFYFNSNEAYSSSGIGLHMCKEYLSLNGGNIAVSSQKGEGTRFVLLLPLSDEGVDEQVSAPISIAPMRQGGVEEMMGQTQDSEIASAQSGHKLTVLIIDDSSELRFYLKQILGRVYNCLTAKNGQQGFEMAREVKPDIVIMDMLMPVVGGAECVALMRENVATKSIPIIMLSSLTDDQSIVKAMKSGADAYLAKPINEALLYVHIERLLSKPVDVARNETGGGVMGVGDVRRGFFVNFEAIVEHNIQNSMLDVNLIAEQMQISRSTLQRSVKSECGMGVAEYVRDYRLRSAVKLMNSGVYNIDELSVCVGFNSTSYFCKAFKLKYGESPKRYCDMLRQRGK